MIPMSGKRAFTMIELLVVVAMISIILATITTSVGSAMERARVQKATSEVKTIAQAVLAYENFAQGHELPTYESAVDVDKQNAGFLLGQGGTSETSTRVPVLIEAALSQNGVMLDPWGHPYRFTIRRGSVGTTRPASLVTGLTLLNFDRLTEEERK